MNHADVKNHLADYLEGDLSLDARALVDAHLDGCAECAEEVDQMLQTIRLLRMLPEPEPPPMITANVMRRIRAGEADPSLLERIRSVVGSILEPGFVLPASAVAAAALVVMAIQDPTSLSRLGFKTEVPANESAVVAVESLTAATPAPRSPESRLAGRTSREERVFGAPAAQNFGVAPEASGSRTASRESGQRPVTGQPRFRIELEPAAPRSPSLYADPSLVPRLPDVFMAQPSNGFDNRTRGSEGWSPYSGGPYSAGMSQRSPGAMALPVAQPRAAFPAGPLAAGESTGGEDKRDEWIARGLADPRGFARYIASQNLAEQELWVSRLSERAEARGLLEELVQALRSSGDAVAEVIAADFTAAAASQRDAVEGGDASR